MSKSVKSYSYLFKCPGCGQDLTVGDDCLRCEECKRIIPIVGGIPIFLSQEETRDFFSGEFLDIFCSIKRDQKNMQVMLKSKDYIKELNKLINFAKTKEAQKLFEDIDDNWIDDPEAQRAVYNELDYIVDTARNKKTKIILDWPTGPGSLVRRLIEVIKQDILIIAYDIDILALAKLKFYLEKNGKAENLIFVNGDARKLPFKNEKLDLVTVFGLMGEVPEPNIALVDTVRCLKNGGAIVGGGEIYKDNSSSVYKADSLSIGHLSTKKRLFDCLKSLGLKNLEFKIFFEGYDSDTLSDEERCPLPARGDWYQIAAIKAEK